MSGTLTPENKSQKPLGKIFCLFFFDRGQQSRGHLQTSFDGHIIVSLCLGGSLNVWDSYTREQISETSR